MTMTIPSSVGYLKKGSSYFNVDRHDLFELVPSDPPGRVLDIGAAEGSMLVALKQSGKARERESRSHEAEQGVIVLLGGIVYVAESKGLPE